MFVENLEGRRLFAVGLVGTQLQVTGSAANDVIVVSQQDPATIRVQENGVVTFFADASVNSILLNGNTAVIGGVAVNPTNGTAGNDSITVVSTAALPLTEPVTVNGGAGNDTIDGGNGTNTLNGGDGNDSMTAGTGRDVFDGGAGVDAVSYSTRTAALNVTLDNVANDGQTTIISLPPPSLPIVIFENDNVRDTVENVIGGSGNDVIVGPALNVNNVFTGNGGNDRLQGNGGNDTLNGGAGDDTLIGNAGDDVLSGSTGNDKLLGGNGNDILFGGDNHDVLDGGLGADSLRGENGDDVLLSADGAADTFLDGGAGFDIADRDGIDPLALNVELLA
jgi:Ca2+-binding RTX toxin-like protein